MGIKSNRKAENTKLIRATKIFSDRMTSRKSFWRKYLDAKKNILDQSLNVSVLTYYGLGGIGKSKLLFKIEQELDSKLSECLDKEIVTEFKQNRNADLQSIFLEELELAPKRRKYIRFDFKEYTDSLTTLCALSDLLKTKYSYEFPLFKIAVHCYKSKVGEKWKYPSVESKFSKGILADVNSFIGSFSIPMLLGTTGIRIIDAIVCKGRDFYNKKLFNDYIQQMEIATIDELIKQLPFYFSLDMSRNIDADKTPFVFLFDTYEVLINFMNESGDSMSNDLWLRDLDYGLITNIPNAMFVIAGRDRLRWEEINPDWADVLEQHRIDELSNLDARNFLIQTGVVAQSKNIEIEQLSREEELRIDKIIQISKGVPLYLDICVNICVEKLKRREKIMLDDFMGRQEMLVERYYRYLSRIQQLYVKIFSCISVWDDQFAMNLDKSRIFSKFDCDTEDYRILRDSSIVKEHGNGRFSIHDLVSQIFMSKTDSMIIQKCCSFLLDEINSKKNDDDLRDLYVDRYIELSMMICQTNEEKCKSLYNIRRYITECLREYNFEIYERSIMKYVIAAEKNNKLDKYYSLLVIMQIQYLSQKWDYTSCIKYLGLEKNIFMDSVLYKEYCWLCARIWYGLGEYDKAYEMDYSIYQEIKGELSFNSAYFCILANIGCDLKKAGRYAKALPFFNKYYNLCLSEYKRTNSLSVKRCYESSLQHMGDIYFRLYDIELAIEFYEKDLELTKEIYNSLLSINTKREMMIAYRKVGDVYREKGQYDLTEYNYQNYYRLANEIDKQHETIRSKCSVAAACDRMGSLYRLLGDLEKAMQFFKEDLVLSEKIQEVQPCLSNLKEVGIASSYVGEIYHEIGNIKTARDYYNKAKLIFEEIFEKQKNLINEKNLESLIERLDNLSISDIS